MVLDDAFFRARTAVAPLIFVFFWSERAGAEGGDFECRWANSEITIDGKADEPAWKNAQAIDDWAIPWKKKPEERAVRSKTRAKLLWDQEFLYFFADMDDADLYGEHTKQDDEIWKDDVFELFFKPAKDKPGYYEFEINVNGAVLDMFLPERKKAGYYEYKSDGKFRVEQKVVTRGTVNEREDEDDGWSVEGKIPWKDFDRTGGAPEPEEIWTFALCRYDYSNQFEKGKELSSSAPLKAGDFHAYEGYAPLRFVGPAGNLPERLQQVGGIDSNVRGSPEPPPLYKTEWAWPDWRVTHLVTFILEPGKDAILFIDQTPGTEPKQVINRLRRFDPKTGEVETLMEVNALVYNIEFHPKFADNGYFFLGANGPNHVPRAERTTGITRYTMDLETGQTNLETAHEIISWKSNGHDGAAMAFDNDGLFYVTTGDGTSDSDDDVNGQRMEVLHAKVLRIDIDNPDPGKSYSVPKDNPFVDLKGARPETWAYGLRNPWRMSYDRETGHLWVGQNGQDLTEQAYFVRKGDNFGWSVYEGSRPFYLERKLGPTPHVLPTFEHGHHEARSLTGGFVYRGDKLKEIQGAYVYGDYTTGKIWAGKHDGEKVTWHREIADTTFGLTDFRQGRDGELLISDYRPKDEGGIHKLVPNTVKPNEKPFPKKLSETGLFKKVKGHQVEPGLLPYTVIAEQWTDGLEKDRFVALPAEDPHITFSKRAWKFPEDTVLVQSLAAPRNGESDERRWIETRLMLLQEGEWSFFSYAWNDEQTDAELVEKEGRDHEIEIGGSKQPWRFPSRSECGHCHSRAGGFVLGLQSAQLNKFHDYGGGFSGNQIETIGKLGLFEGKRRKSRSAPDQRESPELTQFVNLQLDTLDALANPYDASLPVEDRARAYLQGNCAHCHVGSGGGNAQMLMRYFTPTADMKIFDATPNHGHRGLGEDARIATPGNAGLSVIVPRVSSRGPGQMPPIGTHLPDPQGVGLLIQWIIETKAD